MRRPTGKATIIATLALAIGLTGALMVPAMAQGGSTSDGIDQATVREDRRGAFSEALADELGLPADEVADALERVQERMAEQRRTEMRARLDERLDAAVEAGDLTEEQADAIRAAHEAGVLGRPGDGRGGERRGGMLGGGRGPGAGFGPLGGDVDATAESADA